MFYKFGNAFSLALGECLHFLLLRTFSIQCHICIKIKYKCLSDFQSQKFLYRVLLFTVILKNAFKSFINMIIWLYNIFALCCISKSLCLLDMVMAHHLWIYANKLLVVVVIQYDNCYLSTKYFYGVSFNTCWLYLSNDSDI